MPKLTKAQQRVYLQTQKTNGSIYFARNLKTGKETCYVGSVKVSARVWFFFYEIGYFNLSSKTEGSLYDYFYMSLLKYKLEEYLETPLGKFAYKNLK